MDESQNTVGNNDNSNKKKIPYTVVYFIRRDDGLIKIGKSFSIKHRLNTLYNSSSFNLSLLLIIATIDHRLESNLHKKFKDIRVSGEWFSPGKELLNFIDRLKQKAYMDI
jgi:hypothetical protein